MQIGITCSHPSTPTQPKKKASLQRYVDALDDAGATGVPLWRPRVHDLQKMTARAEKLAGQLDGLLVSGGADLHPETYGEEVLPDAKVKLVHPLRPDFESLLIRAMHQRRRPVLGICYGCQYFNVMQGGSLLQDIDLQHPEAMAHHDSRHAVRLQRGSMLFKIIEQEEFEIASYHHQAIGNAAHGVEVTASAPDGVIEAIELDSDPLWMGVQWHPEWDRGAAATQRLFGAFIKACR